MPPHLTHNAKALGSTFDPRAFAVCYMVSLGAQRERVWKPELLLSDSLGIVAPQDDHDVGVRAVRALVDVLGRDAELRSKGLHRISLVRI